MFRDLLGSLKKEAEKRIAQQEEEKKREKPKQHVQPRQQPQPRNRRTGKYGRLAAWIKSNYGNNFRDGQTSDEVKNQLDKITHTAHSLVKTLQSYLWLNKPAT